MKLLLTITRIIVGVLFIFSGLVKANDPLGLSYKMQEYFEVWHLYSLNDYALSFALVMNVFEIVAGIAVILGWRMKLFSWLLLLLIIFFTFLTGYAAFSGKIAACGCFGDCIPLTPIQSFWKDVILLVLILFLLVNHRKIKPILSSKISVTILVIATLAVSVMQWYVLEHLPFVDCLPYKKGNDLLEQMKTPSGFIADEYSYVFKYRKDEKVLEFPEDKLPEDLDDTYEFINREEKLVKKGNGLKANITDFNLVTQSGNDTTQAILSQKHKYILIFANSLDESASRNYDVELWRSLQKKIPVYVVTSAPLYINDIPVFKADGTVIKTAARVDPTYFVMQGAKILGKFSYANTEEMMELLK
jgi:uncharacterized membrane protein YphA (DoxX/SURF4 family)